LSLPYFWASWLFGIGCSILPAAEIHRTAGGLHLAHQIQVLGKTVQGAEKDLSDFYLCIKIN